MADGQPYSQQSVRTIKNGTLKIKDASDEITCTFMDGGLSMQLRNRPFDVVRHRGAIQQFIELDDEVLELSFSMHLQEFYGDSTTTSADLGFLTPFEAAFGSNNNSVTITSTETTLTGEPTVLTLELTIADPDGAGSETLTFAKCVFPTIQGEEGYPDRYTITALCRGGLSIAVA